jgi:IS6 family transposase
MGHHHLEISEARLSPDSVRECVDLCSADGLMTRGACHRVLLHEWLVIWDNEADSLDPRSWRPARHDPALFKWRHFEADIILCAVRWYLRYALSSRAVEELLRERGVWVDHTTVFRWVQRYAPELEKRCRPLLKATNDSYRADETYIKAKKQWFYLYRAVDSEGDTIDFMLRATRDAAAAERFFRQALGARHTVLPRVITVDKNAAYPLAFEALLQDGTFPETCLLRQCTYFNTVVEQDHRFVKRRVNPGLGFGAFAPAQRTIQGYEAMHRLRKGQLDGLAKRDVLTQNRVINQLFEVAA